MFVQLVPLMELLEDDGSFGARKCLHRRRIRPRLIADRPSRSFDPDSEAIKTDVSCLPFVRAVTVCACASTNSLSLDFSIGPRSTSASKRSRSVCATSVFCFFSSLTFIVRSFFALSSQSSERRKSDL